jgi:hypothetical protein
MANPDNRGDVAEKGSRPFAGITRIRFEGFGIGAVSARNEHPSERRQDSPCGANGKKNSEYPA